MINISVSINVNMRVLHTAIKMTLVTMIAGLVSRWIGLDYWLTGGVLALLSIQLTKKDSITIGIKRIVDVFFAMVLSTIFFVFLGYDFWVFIIVTFIFSLASWRLKIAEGIVPALVIVTHLLIFGEFSYAFFIDEVLLVVVSIGIAMIFNTFYPTFGEKALRKYIDVIDGYIKDHLLMLSFLIKDFEYHETYYKHYEFLEKKLSDTIHQVELSDKDILFQNDQGYLSYVYMRRTQATYMKHMFDQGAKVKLHHRYAKEISDYVKDLSYAIGLPDEGEKHLKQIHDMLDKYRLSALPRTREEFETRAILYQIMLELETFVKVKIEFYETYPDFHISK